MMNFALGCILYPRKAIPTRAATWGRRHPQTSKTTKDKVYWLVHVDELPFGSVTFVWVPDP